YLCDEYLKNNYIDPETSEKLGVKRGLRNSDGTGVLTGLTNVCDVQGYEMVDGVRKAVDGKLIYRGINVEDIVQAGIAEDRFMFEEVIWLLLFGSLPSADELSKFKVMLESHRQLPPNFVEDMIIKAPSPNIMNKLGRSVLALYSYDENPEDMSLANVIKQSITLIASLPAIMVNAYQVKRRVYDQQSMFFHMPVEGLSIAEHILCANRADQQFTKEEARLLDLCLVMHADHGGGNNSTFACRVLSSTGTDTYSAISAAIGSLKGPKHGGANIKVMEMLDYILEGVEDPCDDDCIKEFLRKIIRKQAGDGSGLIYGMGHAVYTKSDPRAKVLREHAAPLAIEKGYEKEFNVLCAVERLGPQVFAEEKGNKEVCANVDLYSGLIYRMLGLSNDLFTPMFAISRIPGWCAHRAEEIVFANRIIRPAYKYLGVSQKYIPLDERK
ncbi:MAG: citrate synthase, partial [Oscillospiraceae bacterium]